MYALIANYIVHIVFHYSGSSDVGRNTLNKIYQLQKYIDTTTHETHITLNSMKGDIHNNKYYYQPLYVYPDDKDLLSTLQENGKLKRIDKDNNKHKQIIVFDLIKQSKGYLIPSKYGEDINTYLSENPTMCFDGWNYSEDLKNEFLEKSVSIHKFLDEFNT